MILGGRLLSPRGPVPGFLQVERGMAVAWGLGPPPAAPVATGLVAPSFVDAHTHVGDAFLWGEPVPRDLSAAVAPPSGFKHRRLAEADDATVSRAVRSRLSEMARRGTGCAVDFREGGAEGARLVEEAAEGLPVDLLVLGRPGPKGLDGLEGRVHGLGLSSVADLGEAEAGRLARFARSFEGLLGLHFAEGVPEPLAPVARLRPDLVVHANEAPRADLLALARRGAGLVTCPTSSRHFGLEPMGARALAAGLTPLLGTDNAMLSEGDVLAEAHQLADLARSAEAAPLLLQALTYEPRRVLGLPSPRWARELFSLPEARRWWGGIPLAGSGGAGCEASVFFEGWNGGLPRRGPGFRVVPGPPPA